ncbi:MAG TPA: hypothetical protein VNX21_08880 [Candidatus Thermoplasmatota archaeon]|nr:hypothetical protein [Candidatus Thermoplasmatota archaeon]
MTSTSMPPLRRLALAFFAIALLLTPVVALLRGQEAGTLPRRLAAPVALLGLVLLVASGALAWRSRRPA